MHQKGRPQRRRWTGQRQETRPGTGEDRGGHHAGERSERRSAARRASGRAGLAWRGWVAFCLGLALVSGCSVVDRFAPAPESPPFPARVVGEAREYRIGVPDLLELTVWQHPDVSGPLLVRRDGKVSVPLMGDIQAEGRTPLELAGQIRRGLSDYIANPRVDVAVMEMRSQVASVIGGGVVRSGQIQLQHNTRVVDAIAEMGGFTPFARKRRILILRDEGDETLEYRFDYEAFVGGLAPESNFLLEPGDTIIVPD